MAENMVITIGRQFGSGGREIGVRLGELLGFKVYDKELITLAAQKNGVSPDYLRRVDEKATNSLLYTLALGSSLYGARNFGIDVPINDQLFITQTEIIKKAAEEGDCIFIGRCADYVLKERVNIFNVFVQASLDYRLKRVVDVYGESEKKAGEIILKNDKRRANYYNYHVGEKWTNLTNYDMVVRSDIAGIDKAVESICTYLGE